MDARPTGRITVRDRSVADKILEGTGLLGRAFRDAAPGVAARDCRLFSLEQRAALKGSHQRCGQPVEGKRYVAGVALPDMPDREPGASPVVSLFPSPVTVTIAEEDALGAGGVLHLVDHYRWPERPQALLQRLREILWGVWRCQAVLVDSIDGAGRMLSLRPRSTRPGDVAGDAPARTDLCRGLLAAVDSGCVKMYADDGSPESREFWSQAVRCRRRWEDGGVPDFFIEPSTGDDGFLVSLALATHAAKRLRAGLSTASVSAA